MVVENGYITAGACARRIGRNRKWVNAKRKLFDGFPEPKHKHGTSFYYSFDEFRVWAEKVIGEPIEFEDAEEYDENDPENAEAQHHREHEANSKQLKATTEKYLALLRAEAGE